MNHHRKILLTLAIAVISFCTFILVQSTLGAGVDGRVLYHQPTTLRQDDEEIVPSATLRRSPSRVFHGLTGYVPRVCTDGAAVALRQGRDTIISNAAISLTYSIYVTASISSPVTTAQQVGFLGPRPLETYEVVSLESPYCQAIGGTWCAGLDYIRWAELLQPGAAVTVTWEIGQVYVDSSGALKSMVAPSTWAQDFWPILVEDCRLDDESWLELLRTSNSSADDQAKEDLVLRVLAVDPDWWVVSGGVSSVFMWITDASSTTVHSITVTHVPTDTINLNCAFGQFDQQTCNAWNFAEHNYTWPNGAPIGDGVHRLHVKTQDFDGDVSSAEWLVDIERTFWQHSLYLPYTGTGHWSSIALPARLSKE